jgi:hypothetical protein
VIRRTEGEEDGAARQPAANKGEHDASKWLDAPATAAELSLAAIADWGPAEDWADWDDAAR